MDFKSYCNKNSVSEKELKEKAKTASNVDVGNLENMISKYKDMNQSELYQELFKMAETQKKNGTLNKQTLNNIYNSLSPMLNEKDKQNLQNILNMIG